MCNPNALFYQQMVNAQNAYWLNFFLKRDVNVMCWNYRGYGESTKGYFDTLNPATSKRDAEKVLAFIVDNLGIKGKIGVYGRSIGGITACHLAQKYHDLVELIVCDRTLNELQTLSEQKLKGKATTFFFDSYTNGWKCKNPQNFVESKGQYKIITCDPADDTVDLFSSL
jgi:pimeloyl-ACP methyl ester carboxylesterase